MRVQYVPVRLLPRCDLKERERVGRRGRERERRGERERGREEGRERRREGEK